MSGVVLCLTQFHPVCLSDVSVTVCSPYTLLSLSLDPIIVQPAARGVKMKSLLFATQTDCVLVGDSDGQVTVYQLRNLSVRESSQVKLGDRWPLCRPAAGVDSLGKC